MLDTPPAIEINPGVLRPDLYDSGAAYSTSRRIKQRVRIFLAVFLLSGICSLTYTFIRPAVYESTASLHIDLTAASADDVAVVNPIAFQRQVLTSQSILADVLTRLSANASVSGDTPIGLFELRKMLSATQVPDTNVVELRAEGPDPAILPILLNTWTEVYLASYAVSEETSSRTTDAALRERFASLEEKVLAKRQELEEFRSAHDIVSMERTENRALRNLQGLTDSLNRANEEEVATGARLIAIQQAITEGKPIGRKGDQRALANLEKRAVELREQLEVYEQRFTPEYMAIDPEILTVVEQSELVEERLRLKREELQQVALTEVEQELVSASRAAADIRQQLADSQKTTAEFTTRFAEHEALQEELLHLEELYREVNKTLVVAEVTSDTLPPQVTVMEPGIRKDVPIGPHYSRDAQFSVLGSLLLGLLMVVVYELFTRPAGESGTSESRTVILPWLQSKAITAPAEAQLLPAATPPPSLEHQLSLELTCAEVQLILEAGNDSTRLLVALLLSGLDIEEVSVLCWRSIDLDRNELRVFGQDERSIPISPLLRELLAGTASASPDEPVLVDTIGEAMGTDDLEALITCVAHDSGVSDATAVTAAALRHTYLVFLVRNGIRLAELGDIAGYLPPTELAKYGSMSPRGPGLSREETDLLYPVMADSGRGQTVPH